MAYGTSSKKQAVNEQMAKNGETAMTWRRPLINENLDHETMA